MVKQLTYLAILLAFFQHAEIASGFTFLGNIQAPSLSSITKSIVGDKFGGKKLCIITGTSSGLGKNTAKSLLEEGLQDYHVICAVRDTEKMELVAEMEGFNKKSYTIMELDLNSFSSVRRFADNVKKLADETPIDRLVCNAAVYQPSLQEAQWSEDGIEQQMQINYLSHFLLISLLMPEMKAAKDPRCIMVGSVTGNDNTVGGGGVYPIADLRELEGLKAGAVNPVSMMDGRNFNGAKAYKDSKLAIMMTSNALHERYHRSTGITFSSIYPGCIAESPLFREKKPWFRKYFPMFMKYITGGFVSEPEAGFRLFQVITDPRCTRSGVYWSWNGGPRQGRGMDALQNGGKIVGAGGAGGGWDSIYENDQSDKVQDPYMTNLLWELSNKVTGADWPLARQPKSPCPTLKVISAVTAIADKLEDASGATKKAKEAKSMKDVMAGLSF
jgi:protochlorophyllide reductase